MTGGTPLQAYRAALRLFHSGLVADPAVRREGKLEAALPIQAPNGADAGWFVAVTLGRKLAGFFQLDPALRLVRYATSPGQVADYPDAALWLDTDRVAAVARQALPDGRPAGKPCLSYDANPTRLVWAVPLEAPDGRRVMVYVAGEYAYIPTGGSRGWN